MVPLSRSLLVVDALDVTPERERLLETVTSILEKYLEQPHLLDTDLDTMMAIVMNRAKDLVTEREAAVMAASCPGEAFPFQVHSHPSPPRFLCRF